MIKCEDIHYKLTYFRLINPSVNNQKGFKERKRRPDEIERDLNLATLKNQLLSGHLAIE